MTSLAHGSPHLPEAARPLWPPTGCNVPAPSTILPWLWLPSVAVAGRARSC